LPTPCRGLSPRAAAGEGRVPGEGCAARRAAAPRLCRWGARRGAPGIQPSTVSENAESLREGEATGLGVSCHGCFDVMFLAVRLLI